MIINVSLIILMNDDDGNVNDKDDDNADLQEILSTKESRGSSKEEKAWSYRGGGHYCYRHQYHHYLDNCFCYLITIVMKEVASKNLWFERISSS